MSLQCGVFCILVHLVFCQKTVGTNSKWLLYGGIHPQELIILMGS